jgi:hypothetical protein
VPAADQAGVPRRCVNNLPGAWKASLPAKMRYVILVQVRCFFHSPAMELGALVYVLETLVYVPRGGVGLLQQG